MREPQNSFENHHNQKKINHLSPKNPKQPQNQDKIKLKENKKTKFVVLYE